MKEVLVTVPAAVNCTCSEATLLIALQEGRTVIKVVKLAGNVVATTPVAVALAPGSATPFLTKRREISPAAVGVTFALTVTK